MKAMHYKRLAVGVAVVNRLLYAIGGYDGNVRHNSAECYHPENDEWNMIAPMHTPRSGAGASLSIISGLDPSNDVAICRGCGHKSVYLCDRRLRWLEAAEHRRKI